MNIGLILLIINILLFVLITTYFFVQRKQLADSHKALMEEGLAQSADEEKSKNELDEMFVEAKNRSSYILSESESIANDVTEELEDALGKESDGKIILPIGENYELKLEKLRQTIQNQYKRRIEKLFAQLESIQLKKAQNVDEYADQQMISTDQNLQKLRMEKLVQMQERIDRYKREEIALFTEKVKKVVDDAAIEFFEHALSREDQEELIAKALKLAREKNGL